MCRSQPGPASSWPTCCSGTRRTPTPSSTTRAAGTARCTGPAVLLVALGTFLGWGLVTNGLADWLTWQGYLLEPFGLGGKDGAWAFANLGVFVAFAVGFVGWAVLGRTTIARQESTPAAPAASAAARS